MMRSVARALAGQGIEEYDLFEVRRSSEGVCYENGKLERLTSVKDENLALRLKKDGRLGCAMSSHQGSEPSSLAGMALAAAAWAEPAGFDFAPEAPWTPRPPSNLDWPLERQLESVQEALDLVCRFVPAGLKTSVHASSVLKSTAALTSAGFEGSYDAKTFSLGIGVNGFLESGFVYLYESDSRPAPDCAPSRLAAALLRKLPLLRRTAAVTNGRLPAILSPASVASLLSFVREGLSGRNVLKGVSPLSRKLGQAVFSPEITIVDDPGQPELANGRPFDDEGVPAKALALVEKGVVASFLTDLHSAAGLGLPATGNALRDSMGRGRPAPRFTNVVLPAGTMALEDMIKGLKRGLLIDSEMGVSNLLAGDFSCAVGIGWLVADGEIRGRLKDTMVAGNVYELLGRSVAASSERERVYGCHLLPHLMVDGVQVSV